MVAPIFILTRTFAISAMFVGAFPVAYGAPVPSESGVSRLDPRSCRQMGCLDASSDTSLASPSSATTDTDSAIQVIDFLISALRSAASDINQKSSSSSAPSTNTAVDAALPSSFDTVDSTEDESTVAGAIIDAVIAAVQSGTLADEDGSTSSTAGVLATDKTLSSGVEDSPSSPAVDVVGFSTVSESEVDARSETV
ncbi:hypothetical protein BD413DRAFT_603405 [Trametes elegans]|nr:hypothetical protein BD413DRAFT_603405 [Trametes elegans]